MKAITFELPYPPSVNRYWRSVVMHGYPRVILSADGRKFKDECKKIIASTLKAYGISKDRLPLYSISEKVDVSLELYAPTRRVSDVDNYSKATLDALTAAGVWEDDSQAGFLQVGKCGIVKGGKVVVRLYDGGTLSRKAFIFDDPPF